jgi:hypothetical protein
VKFRRYFFIVKKKEIEKAGGWGNMTNLTENSREDAKTQEFFIYL